jgi:hypothetical protein
MNGKKVVWQSCSARREECHAVEIFFSRFSHLNFFHSQQLSLEKVQYMNAEPNDDEERRGGDVWFLAWV